MSDAILSPAARAALVRLLRAAYPHPDFPDGPYERAAEAVVTATAEDLCAKLAPLSDEEWAAIVAPAVPRGPACPKAS